MEPSFDCVASLLCTEEDSSVFDDVEYGGSMEDYEDLWHPRNEQRSGGVPNELHLPLQSEECLVLMLEKECQQWHGADYLNRLKFGDLDFGARNEAIDWIQKVQSHFGFGPLCVYLSINYMDRFLSAYQFPERRDWSMQLLAVACLSLAAKVDETDVPRILELQIGESKFVFEAKTIQKIELLVLTTLKWRMQAITPFSFIEYFLSKINDDKSSLNNSIILQCTQLISSTIKSPDFLEFKPSEIAAAVATYVVEEFQAIDSSKSISTLIQYIEKERLLKCVEKVQEMCIFTAKDSNASSVSSVLQSPMGMFDTLRFRYKCDDNNAGVDAKRRKLNKRCGLELL
ncbi:putative cyclin B3, G2/mitotic-specific [Medicago truncatula]|uniref:B-like cyclin n=1 Tax=Medicago truncatula TaxID=3880 RepID=G7JDW7_MEDTR|nr:cyclin-D4-2 [Medicago truncatula]AES89862.1 carboxy-terminal domain cyclin [Medicago truncatula]RHN61908.1 putative cyclin B3, G2/mitotic-specific [Medicago truncatula]